MGILWGLFGSLVGHHLVLDCGEDVFDGGRFLPVLEQGKVLDSSVALVDAGKVAFIIEFEDGSDLGI